MAGTGRDRPRRRDRLQQVRRADPDSKAIEAKPRKAITPKTFTRLFVQDLETCSLRWADLNVGEKDEFTLGSFAAIEGFKKLDPEKLKLVQMKESEGLVCGTTMTVRSRAAGCW